MPSSYKNKHTFCFRSLLKVNVGGVMLFSEIIHDDSEEELIRRHAIAHDTIIHIMVSSVISSLSDAIRKKVLSAIAQGGEVLKA